MADYATPVEVYLGAVPTTWGELLPGDLFSELGQEYWEARSPDNLGEQIYVRTNKPVPEGLESRAIYRIVMVWNVRTKEADEAWSRTLQEASTPTV